MSKFIFLAILLCSIQPVHASQVAVGSLHSCAIIDKYLWCWGSNSRGQIGGLKPISKPHLVTKVKVMAVSAGASHSCAIDETRNLFCWGANDHGQSGQDPKIMQVVPADNIGNLSSIIATDIDEIALGSNFSCALRHGEVFCWGGNDFGQLGNDIALKNNPLLYQVRFANNQPLKNITKIAAGWGHGCALSGEKGQVFCWGLSKYGQRGDGIISDEPQFFASAVLAPDRKTIMSGFSQITAAGHHSCAVKGGGKAYCWGLGKYLQRGDNDTLHDRPYAAPVLLEQISFISAGSSFGCAIYGRQSNASCWGQGGDGQRGDGTFKQRSGKAVQVVAINNTPLSGVLEIASGAGHSCARTAGSSIYCWGRNNGGQLGLSLIQPNENHAVEVEFQK